MTPRFDHDRHEPADVQARIQLAAAAKRERKRRARVRAAELTALGREVERADAEWAACAHRAMWALALWAGRNDDDAGRIAYEAARDQQFAALDAMERRSDALAARRAQP